MSISFETVQITAGESETRDSDTLTQGDSYWPAGMCDFVWQTLWKQTRSHDRTTPCPRAVSPVRKLFKTGSRPGPHDCVVQEQNNDVLNEVAGGFSGCHLLDCWIEKNGAGLSILSSSPWDL